MKNSLSTIALALAMLSGASQAQAYCPEGDSLTKVWQLPNLRADQRNLVRVGSYEKPVKIGNFTVTARWPAACVNGSVVTFDPTGPFNLYGWTLDDDLQVCVEGAQSVTIGVISDSAGYNCGTTNLKPFRYEGFFLHLEGTSGDDYMYGGSGIDYISGWNGNDSLYGLGGNDYLSGFYGNDTLRGGPGNDKLYGDYGRDTLTDEQGYDALLSGSDNDFCVSDDDNSFSNLDCGSGTDTAGNQSNTRSCENYDNYCYWGE